MPGDLAPTAVLGAGSWGTALAVVLAGNGHPVRLWGRGVEHARAMDRERRNARYLPAAPFPAGLSVSARMDASLDGVRMALVAVPSHAFRDVAGQAAALLGPQVPVAWATKGLEPGSGALLHEVAAECLGDRRALGVVSGPSFAAEVAAGLPAAVTVAATTAEFAEAFAAMLHNGRFRAYTNADVVGVEIGGAVKNVLAIAAGIADGLGFGANTRAALVTRGLAELMRFGEARGARRETLMGLAGLGDLVLTCTDDQSRNRRFGLALARGLDVEAARAEVGQAVEGLFTAREVARAAARLGVEMPIVEQVDRVLHEGVAPGDAVRALLARDVGPEVR